ncbi:MAG: hypothetical protein NC131_08270 [Roseburia sp.]|nr:hypothetical protein [Roseburia sp.]
MGLNRNWTPEEEEYLKENWGVTTIPGIAKHLNRSVNAIKVRVARLGLGPYLESGEYVTFHQLAMALGYGGGSDTYKLKSWAENRGFPIHNKRRDKSVIRVVYLDEFWEWAEQHRSFLDFSKMEPLALGAEPDWVAEQRKKDYTAFAIQRKDTWTEAEDSRLKMLLSQHKYTWAELSKELRRSCGAIDRRIRDLGLTDRPIRIPCGGRQGTWTDAMFRALADGIRHGDSYQSIADTLGVSEKAVRGKVYYDYLTESADKVRRMMGDGPWGTGRPEPTVKQAASLSRTRVEVRDTLSRLDAILRFRMNQLGYDPYWQRFMCQHWHDIKGCTAGGENCDDCTSFQRIRPQYCARCGATFYEREDNRFCTPCRQARLKKAQRRWCRSNGRQPVAKGA